MLKEGHHESTVSVAWCGVSVRAETSPLAAGASEWQVAVLTWGGGRQVWWGGRDELVRQQVNENDVMGGVGRRICTGREEGRVREDKGVARRGGWSVGELEVREGAW